MLLTQGVTLRSLVIWKGAILDYAIYEGGCFHKPTFLLYNALLWVLLMLFHPLCPNFDSDLPKSPL